MLWLNIFENKSILLAAEILVIVIGSMILGILLCYLTWGNLRGKNTELEESLEAEKKQTEELRAQVSEINQLRSQLQQEVDGFHLQSNGNAKTIYDQQQYIFSCEAELKKQKANADQLNASIDCVAGFGYTCNLPAVKVSMPVWFMLRLWRLKNFHISELPLMSRLVLPNDPKTTPPGHVCPPSVTL
jgi:F0F1-type ATP synthase membrane subunit b/b'